HVIPVLYTRGAYTVPVGDPSSAADPAPVTEAFDDLDSLMYRDDLVARLDRQLATRKPVVVHGPVATGKSRFLRAFAGYATLTRALRTHSVEQICWQLTCGAPTGVADPLSDESVVRCLDRLPPSSLKTLALLGLGGSIASTPLMAILTDRGLVNDPFQKLSDG